MKGRNLLPAGLAGFASLLAIGAQSAGTAERTQKFEAATIKPCGTNGPAAPAARGGGGSRSMSISPGRLSMVCMTIEDLIGVAWLQYGDDPLLNDSKGPFDPARVRGGPAWAHSSRYTIEAKADASSTNPGARQMEGPMLRELLQDRFQLKAHREVENTSAYSLAIAKSGLKLKPSDGSCTPFVMGSSYDDPSVAPDGRPWCANRSRSDGGRWILDSAGQSINGLGQMLTRPLGQPVIDKTGATGVYAFHLEFAADESAPGSGRGPGREVVPSSDPSVAPSVFTALEQQLGLKLTADKARRGFVVIDTVERPSQN